MSKPKIPLQEQFKHYEDEQKRKGVHFPEPVQTRPLTKNTEKRLKVGSSCPMMAHLLGEARAILHAGSLPFQLEKGDLKDFQFQKKSRKNSTNSNTKGGKPLND